MPLWGCVGSGGDRAVLSRSIFGRRGILTLIRVGTFGLVEEAGIFLIAFGGEADVVELNLIRAGLGHELGQRDVEILYFGLRRGGPDQLAVFAPGLTRALRLHGEFRMFGHHALVTEKADAGEGVQVLGREKGDELRQVVKIGVRMAWER